MTTSIRRPDRHGAAGDPRTGDDRALHEIADRSAVLSLARRTLRDMRRDAGLDPDVYVPWRCYTRDERMQVLEVFALASDREWRIVWPLRPAPCPSCGGSAHVDCQWDGCVVHCGDCYDPSPVHSESGFRDLIGQGDTEAAAISDWNSRVEELAS